MIINYTEKVRFFPISVIIFFSASKQFFFAEMMCKQLIFCVKAAIRLPMSVMLLFIDFKNK
jgi:hypothetical protein